MRPEAVSIDPGRVVAAGTVLFLVAFVALLPFWTWLGEHHHRDWLWTSLAGWLLGIVGWTLMRKHRREGRV